ncbi:hypothetical protein OFO07_00050 [Campylobacter sp. JMF_06 NA1]|uniref:hypothetical protein n=1 Tax=Campylobacter sp. JMF_06 NA1 TaxID=2983823 RepID=UPI0022E9CC9F|nr:hypothetical protein [Campylobacter sp. JMF_06 NA1]MDA3077318.1 hypothetical protein [Campylobacter sp. JMF_06 NA1]
MKKGDIMTNNQIRNFFLVILLLMLIYFVAWFSGLTYAIGAKLEAKGHNYAVLGKYYENRIEKEIDVSKQGNKFEMNISVADSGFYRFGLGYDDRAEFREKYNKIYNELWKKYHTDKKNPYSIDKKYTYEEYQKEECEKLPLMRIYGRNYHSSDYALECKPSQIILKFHIISHDEKNIIKQYTDGINEDMYAVLDYNRTYPFEFVCDTTKVSHHNRLTAKVFSKKCFAVGLYKGDYKIIVETLSHTPETAEILTLFLAERDNYGKMNEFENKVP